MLRQERERYNVSLMERMAKAAEGAASRVQLTQVLLALLIQKYLLTGTNVKVLTHSPTDAESDGASSLHAHTPVPHAPRHSAGERIRPHTQVD